MSDVTFKFPEDQWTGLPYSNPNKPYWILGHTDNGRPMVFTSDGKMIDGIKKVEVKADHQEMMVNITMYGDMFANMTVIDPDLANMIIGDIDQVRKLLDAAGYIIINKEPLEQSIATYTFKRWWQVPLYKHLLERRKKCNKESISKGHSRITLRKVTSPTVTKFSRLRLGTLRK